MTDLCESFMLTQCKIIGCCFRESGYEQLDSDLFAEQFLTSDYGISILTDIRLSEYADAKFMLEGLIRELKPKKGLVYDTDVLWLSGYVYKYWVSTRDADPRDVYKLAPIRLFANRYEFYHTQGFEYIIDDIISRPYK
jgi:hypothetical protein